MTYEEVKTGIENIIAKPETAATDALELLENIKTDYEGMASLITEKEQMQTKIKDLQDTNIKLFLSQTSPVDEEKSEDDKANEILNNFWEDNKNEK